MTQQQKCLISITLVIRALNSSPCKQCITHVSAALKHAHDTFISEYAHTHNTSQYDYTKPASMLQALATTPYQQMPAHFYHSTMLHAT